MGVGVLLIGLAVLRPDWLKNEVEFQCPPNHTVEAVYADMAECSKAMESGRGRGCRCHRHENPWARPYVNYGVPLVLGVVGSLVFIGPVGAKIGWLNAGFWGSVFGFHMVYALARPIVLVGLAAELGGYIYVAVVASIVLAVLHFVGRRATALRSRA